MKNFVRRNARVIVLVLVCAVLGSYLLASSHAASPYASSEAESGSLAGGATIISESSASGGEAIQFAGSMSSSPGTWTNVTPSNMDLVDGSCGNYGTQTVVADSNKPSNLYAEANCQGIWKSTDYGQTWTGPINTGTNGATVSDCAGGIALSPSSGSGQPTLYESCIRGSGTGFWRSTDGGVDWTNEQVGPAPAGRQDMYQPTVDPDDGNHLLMAGHEQDLLVQSTDGGQTWTNVTLNAGMDENGGTAFVFFINTGSASTTANTWLYIAQQNGGTIGTWRTTDGGASWTQVDTNEHPHGEMQIYQPGNCVVYMAGAYSAEGWGVLRSSNCGQTWTHVGSSGNQAIVFGTPNNVYSNYSWACGCGPISSAMQSAPQPGITGWSNMTVPAGMTIGPAETATVLDGSNYVIVGANWSAGLWRYVEPQ